VANGTLARSTSSSCCECHCLLCCAVVLWACLSACRRQLAARVCACLPHAAHVHALCVPPPHTSPGADALRACLLPACLLPAARSPPLHHLDQPPPPQTSTPAGASSPRVATPGPRTAAPSTRMAPLTRSTASPLRPASPALVT
jgi:hypothetical protein